MIRVCSSSRSCHHQLLTRKNPKFVGSSSCPFVYYPRTTRRPVPCLSTSSSSLSTTSTTVRKILKYGTGSVLLGSVGMLTYMYQHVGGTSEGLFRTISFYSVGIPKYFEYRYHMWKESPDHVWEELDRSTSQMGLSKILELQGFYIKTGQLCAANIGNAFPQIWQDTMSVLQDEVPAQPFEVIRQIIAEDGIDFDKTFLYMNPKPLGAASIGQVHEAILNDENKTKVVVKVCYPHVERLLKGDVRTIKLFCKLAQPVHVPSLEEIEKQFQTEFDYRTEAKHLQLVHDNLQRANLLGPNRLCQVPRPYMEHCTKRVLVMEQLKGDKLIVGLKKDLQHHADRAGQSVEEFKAALVQKEKERKQQAQNKVTAPTTTTTEKDELAAAATQDEVNGPSVETYNFYTTLLDTQRKLQNGYSFIYNSTIGLLPGTERKQYIDKSILPINHAKLVDDLIYIHGHEILVDGLFNGDPHPGNILLCRTSDGSPQLGLIDYGQVKALDKAKRHLFAKIIIALDDNNQEEVVRLMKIAGYKSDRMDPNQIYLYARVAYDQDNEKLTEGLHIQMFMEELQRRDPISDLPEDFLAIQRCSLLLRGLAHALHQSRSLAKTWRPIAERVLEEDI